MVAIRYDPMSIQPCYSKQLNTHKLM
uniref:Uncharacterized protein n=1 Tax=Anguilla anguilla TaxID=7936 RepID=A0A0E9VLX8_ANGAN